MFRAPAWNLELETWKTIITEFLHTYYDYGADNNNGFLHKRLSNRVLLVIRELVVSVVSTLGKFLTNCERENMILTSFNSRSNFLEEKNRGLNA